MKRIEETVLSKEVFCGKIFNLKLDIVRLENGNMVEREIIQHGGGVAVLARDENEDILFVRQFRYAYGEELLELPAGKLEKGEAPELCGVRELEEETGYKAESLDSLGIVYPTPGYTNEALHLYNARGLTKTQQRLDQDELLDVERYSLTDAVHMCMSGEIKDAKTIIAILKYSMLAQQGK